ncbi:MAG: MATE family efflux transporter [Bacteroidaceae bacterium]|nr:MATE family efflux transporter [Bacteroidaceae bacterium]
MAGRDDIDFGTVKISKLFKQIFIPTLLGMASWSLITVADGVFVGQGVGSHGIAAINICYPIFLVFGGFALMMGMGASVVAAIHMSQKNVKAARINITQAVWFSMAIVAVAMAVIYAMPERISLLLGASPSLLQPVIEYMVYLLPSAPFMVCAMIGLFAIRLDGSPKYAMWCNVVPAMMNMLLDWIFIFPLDMGIKGAAIASSLSSIVGGVLAFIYMGSFAKELKLYRLKATAKSIALSLRNIGYQCKVGFPAMLGDVTMAMLMFVGNRAFMEHAGNDGVGAFGVACYYLPFMFMFGNAVAESAQPIVSYNYGAGHAARVNATLAISCRTAVVGALLSVVAFTMFAQELVNMFIGTADPAAIIAINGFPYFAMGFVFFVLNLVAIGFLQSIERVAPAMMFALLRGVLFMVPCFVLLPELMGIRGIWLAMPLTEAATFLLVVLYMLINRKRLF